MRKPNYWYLCAALLCLFMMGMQIFIGSPQLNAPIQQSALPPGIRAVAEVAWHSVTTAYGLMVVALIYLFMRPNNGALAKYIIAQLVALSILFLTYSITRFSNVTSIYLWPIFLVIAVTVGMGVRKVRSRISGESFFDLFITPSPQELESPQNPRRFTPAP